MSTDALPTSRPRWWLTPAKYALGFVVLGYVVKAHWYAPEGAPGTGLSDALQQPIDFTAAVLAALFMVPGLLITIVRWWTLARALDLPLSLHEATRLGLLGYFFNTMLPGGVGGDAVKVAAVVRSQERRTAAVASILFDRAVGLGGAIVLVVLAGGVFWLTGAAVLDNQNLRYIIFMSSLLLAIALMFWLPLGWLPAAQVERWGSRLQHGPRAMRIFAEFARSLRTYRHRKQAVWVAIILSVVNHATCVVAFHFASRIFVFDAASLPTLKEHFLIAPVGLVIKALFPAPGGAGGGELSFGTLYGFVGSPASRGVLASLAWLVLTWVLGVAAYVVALLMGAKATLPAEAVELNQPAM